MPTKTKKNQKQDKQKHQTRDLFQTPNYAVDLLVPYIPKYIGNIWECAAGEGKIQQRLSYHGYNVIATDIRQKNGFNFLTDGITWLGSNWAIITNPPFSLKRKFYETCLKYGVPFALLIPADYCEWIIRATMNGAEKIVPTNRINFITPSGKSEATGNTSDFHSMWLTWGFGLGRTETFVELPVKERKENI